MRYLNLMFLLMIIFNVKAFASEDCQEVVVDKNNKIVEVLKLYPGSQLLVKSLETRKTCLVQSSDLRMAIIKNIVEKDGLKTSFVEVIDACPCDFFRFDSQNEITSHNSVDHHDDLLSSDSSMDLQFANLSFDDSESEGVKEISNGRFEYRQIGGSMIVEIINDFEDK